MIRKMVFLFLAGCFSFLSLSATAQSNKGTLNPLQSNIKHKQIGRNLGQGWFAGIGVGTGRINLPSKTQSVYYTPYSFYDTYSTRHQNSSTAPIISIEGGYRWNGYGKALFAYFLGLRYRYFNSSNMKGNILILNNPSFPYGFNYKTTVQTYSLFGKINLFRMGKFAPYITGGVGVANVRFSDYSEYSKTAVSIARNSAAFASNSSYNFTYDIGLGLDYYLTKSWSVSLGYDYANLGKLKTGPGAYNSISHTTSSLSLGNVSSQTVFLQVDYLFNT